MWVPYATCPFTGTLSRGRSGGREGEAGWVVPVCNVPVYGNVRGRGGAARVEAGWVVPYATCPYGDTLLGVANRRFRGIWHGVWPT